MENSPLHLMGVFSGINWHDLMAGLLIYLANYFGTKHANARKADD